MTTNELTYNALATRLNWLRAGVLGANDGIVSVASIVVGVAAATSGANAVSVIATAGIAGLFAGALSMSTGEYVSVSTQRDSEKAEHARNGTNGHLINPWHAAFASATAFFLGGVLPLLAVLLSPAEWRVWATVVSVVLALIVTGAVSAHLGRSSKTRAILRNVLGGLIAMAITYGVGSIVGIHI